METKSLVETWLDFLGVKARKDTKGSFLLFLIFPASSRAFFLYQPQLLSPLQIDCS
jgi:hypothetical protein